MVKKKNINQIDNKINHGVCTHTHLEIDTKNILENIIKLFVHNKNSNWKGLNELFSSIIFKDKKKLITHRYHKKKNNN